MQNGPLFGSMLPMNLLYIAGNGMVVFWLGWLSWHGFERFFTDLRHHIHYANRREDTP